jgi:hypothetical protein
MTGLGVPANAVVDSTRLNNTVWNILLNIFAFLSEIPDENTLPSGNLDY